MKLNTRNWLIITVEAGLFFIVLIVLWLNEYMDPLYYLFGMPPSPHRLHEYFLESALILLVATVIIAMTIIILMRIERLEGFLRVCAWCKKVWVDDKWVRFEEYVLKKHSLKSSHGICEECLKRQDIKAKHKRNINQRVHNSPNALRAPRDHHFNPQ